MSKDPSIIPMEEIANLSEHIVRKEELHEEVIAKRLKHSMDLQAEEITQEENQLLDADHWYHIDPVHQQPSFSQMSLDLSHLYYHCVMGVVRGAYLSVRKTQADIIEVLKDDTARSFLFQFAFCMSRMKEASLSLREIRMSLPTKANLSYHKCTPDVYVQADSAVSSNPSPLKRRFQSLDHLDSSPMPNEVDNKGGAECLICSVKHVETKEAARQTGTLNTVEKFLFKFEDEIVKLLGQQQKEDSDNFSNKIYHILLILKEIVTQMEIRPEVSEGDKKNMDTMLDAENVGKVALLRNCAPMTQRIC
ncbi:hypothetical protein AQUCO_00800171v1 [Aquilegia coerulea]|uniref:Uncharacterized protein n=1 Tax=Aquilegia coerulea TaxID=218851 RepID=A0A2G5EHM0_AQUCA|nr:hypothetical protein AQUCO_00800171v1 [Aquilegia coerulea]